MVTPQQSDEHEQRQNLFQTRCLVNGKVFSVIVDSGSCANVCALSMVEEAKLPTQDHPMPYKLSWLDERSGVWVKKRALVSFRIGGYMDKLWCDMVPMTACSLLLGRPWQSDRSVIHHGRDNIYSVLKDGERIGLKPLPPKSVVVPKDASSASASGEHSSVAGEHSSVAGVAVPHVCLSSCRDEVLEVASSKKERRAKLLHLRHTSGFVEGDYVWLSLAAQKLHINHKDGEPMDEGPFKVVNKLGYDTYKVLLGHGICATLQSSDLVPCLDAT